MLNSSIESLKVQEAEAISEVPVHISRRPRLSGPAGGGGKLVGCRRDRRLCQRGSERAQVGFSD